MLECRYYPPTLENITAANKDINSYRFSLPDHSGLLGIITELDRARAYARTEELPLDQQIVYDEIIIRAQSLYESIRQQFEFLNPSVPTTGKK